jgi:mRNA interferase MazF
LCPVTNKIKGYPFEVNVPEGLAVTGTILSDQIKSLDWQARNADYICKMPDEVTEQVLAKAATLLE